MLRNLGRGATKNLEKLIMETFKRIWYPGDGGPKPAVNTEPVKSLLALARAVLLKEQKLLSPDKVDLDILLDELDKVGYCLKKEPRQFSSIEEVFKTNPRLYMADGDAVSKALERFYNNLDLAVYRNRVYWKRVYGPGEEPKSGDRPAEALDRLREGDSIAFWKVYAEKFIDQLLEDEREEARPDKVVRRFYVLRTQAGEEERLRDLATHKEELLVMLKDPRITLRLVIEEIETGFYLDVIPSTVETKPRGLIEVGVDVKPVGGFRGEVILDAEYGILEPASGTPPFRACWRLIAKDTEETYGYMITGISGILERRERLTIKVVGEWETIRIPIAEYIPLSGDVIKGFEGLSLTVLRLISSGFSWLGDLKVNIEAEGSPKRGGNVKVQLDGVAYEDVEALIQILDQLVEKVVAGIEIEEKPLDDIAAKRVGATLRGFLPSKKEVAIVKRRRR
jgi:hypothetical protein